jgi:uncharacterized iron-regulated protein
MYNLDKHKVVIIGEIHGVKENLEVVERVFREMGKFGKVKVGFEWPHALIENHDRPDKSLLDDGRYSPFHKQLLQKMKTENVDIFGFDLNSEEWKQVGDKNISWRDEQMAQKINTVLDKLSDNERLLLVCGDAHFQTKSSLIKIGNDIKDFSPMASKLNAPSILAIHLKYLSGQFWNLGLKDVRTYNIDKERSFHPNDKLIEYEVPVATPVRIN